MRNTYEIEVKVFGLKVRETCIHGLLDIFCFVMCVPEFAGQLFDQVPSVNRHFGESTLLEKLTYVDILSIDT